MKKRQCKLSVQALTKLPGDKCFVLDLKLPDDFDISSIKPGQFVNILVANTRGAFLRRPISICDVDGNILRLLVRVAGEGTLALSKLMPDDSVSVVLPLGNGFGIDKLKPNSKALLIGGGVGIAPMLYLGKKLKENGIDVQYILGYRTHTEVILVDEFAKYGEVEVCTDDGTCGTPGLVTTAHALEKAYDYIAVCGPTPMMRAVAKVAREKGSECEVSLENMMACGVGACLCCVEKDVNGHNVCVCTQGPVFNIDNINY